MNMHVVFDRIKESGFIKNMFGIGIYKLLGVVSNLLLIGLIFRYFSNEELNGIWMTVFSIISWLAVFDFGIGNGLRNKLTESIAQGNIDLSKKYITTTYIVMLVPTIAIILIAIISIYIIDWTSLLKITSENIDNHYLSTFILSVVIIYALNFYLSIIFAILHATFKSYKIPMIHFYINTLNLVIIFMLYIFTSKSDLVTLGILYTGSSLITLLINTIHLFKKSNKELAPSLKSFDKSLIKDILGIGMKFLVLQVAIVILFNTDNLLISSYIGVEQVTGYQLVNKILSIYTILLAIVLTPLWTLVIQLKYESNFIEMRKVFRRVFVLLGILIFGVFITCLIIPEIIFLWVGEEISSINTLLIILMGIFTFLHMWCNIFQAILNGLNKLILQVVCYGSAMIINIPVSIWLVKNTELGISAIILGTIISLSIPAIILPGYTWNVLNSSKDHQL